MQTMNKYSKRRSWILIGLIVAIFGVYFFEIMQIQIVDAGIYEEMIQGQTVSTQQIKALRGEVLDRNGVSLIYNQMSYDVILDRAFLPYSKQNETILGLTELFEKAGAEWTDDLPITKSEPFRYIDGMEDEAETLKSAKGAQPYTSAEDMMHWLTDEYKLEDYSKTDARKIISVRYRMERKDFSNRIPYTFAEDVKNEMVLTIRENAFAFPGVDVVSSAVRTYSDDKMIPHILGQTGPLYKEEYDILKEEGKIYTSEKPEYDTRGYTMDDTIGKNGIEKALEETLRGSNGLREIHIDATGNVVAENESVKTIAGNTVMLTIDTEMQKKLDEALEAQIKHLNETQKAGEGGEANAGSAIVLNPKTGEILAASTYPTYSIKDYRENYNEVANREGKPLINRAFMGQYTPGSIFKPVVALAGLENEVITKTSTFHCGGVYNFFAPSYTPRCLSTHGNIGVNNAIGWSCNIFFYETGRLVGIEEIDQMSKALGLGEPTGVEVEEGGGQRSNPEIKELRGGGEWYGADTIQTAIGQFDNRFTPIQLANYTATIANRGQRMELTLVKEVLDYAGTQTVKPFAPQVAYEMADVSRENFEITIEGMISSVIGSSGGTFGGYPITIASKTGTPQVTEKEVNSTYISFAPAQDPELVVVVVIEEGGQGYTGAPVAKAIYDDYFGIDHRGAVASGPQRLEDLRNERAELGESGDENQRDIDVIFPQFIDGIPSKDQAVEETL